MVDQSVRHPDAFLFFGSFQPLDDNFSLPKLSVQLVSLQLWKSVHPEEGPAVTQSLRHPILGCANVLIECLRVSCLSSAAPADSGSTYANAKNPANITLRMAASSVHSQSPNYLSQSVAFFNPIRLLANVEGNQANGAARLASQGLHPARIS